MPRPRARFSPSEALSEKSPPSPIEGTPEAFLLHLRPADDLRTGVGITRRIMVVQRDVQMGGNRLQPVVWQTGPHAARDEHRVHGEQASLFEAVIFCQGK